MPTGIFLIRDGELTEMAQQEPEKEKVLQDLLASHPSLLAGGDMNPEAPRRFAHIAQEVGLESQESGSTRWSVDHLFVDQDAVPTIVEVKRSSNTQIRREVIGQLIEYAANGVKYWPIDRVRAQYEASCAADGVDSGERLREALGSLDDVDEFWQAAKQNLETGRVRMVFVGDVVPPELQRVVEFLNEQMAKAEVLAVELRYYRADNLTTLVPRVVGQTAKAQQLKGQTQRATVQDFLDHLRSQHGDVAVVVASRIIEWARVEKLNPSIEAATEGPTLWAGLHAGGASYWPIRLRHDGKLFISFLSLKKRAPFSDEGLRSQLLDKLNSVPGVSLPASLTGRPAIPISVLESAQALDELLAVLSWLMRTIREHVATMPVAIEGGDQR